MKKTKDTLRSRRWFDSDRPVIGIAQTGSDLAPYNRYHLELATHVKQGILDAGGIPVEFPVHPVAEPTRRPAAALDRNLQCLSLIEVLHGNPIDGVVLTTGCENTTGALLMGAASVNIPAIALAAGPTLGALRPGSDASSDEMTRDTSIRPIDGDACQQAFEHTPFNPATSSDYCNTMDAALTLGCLSEALGMSLPGSASIPAPYPERRHTARQSGRRIVNMVREDLTPSRILVREAFENAIVVCAAIGGSTAALVHINALARHANVSLSMRDWQDLGQRVPQLVNCRPVGEYCAEEFHRAGGLPAVMGALDKAGLLRGDAITASGKPLADNWRGSEIIDERVIRTVDNPVRENAGFLVLSGNLPTSTVYIAN